MTEPGNAPEAARRHVVIYRDTLEFTASGKIHGTSFLFPRAKTELATDKPADQQDARTRPDKPPSAGSFRFGYRLVAIVRDGDRVVELVSQQLFGNDQWFPADEYPLGLLGKYNLSDDALRNRPLEQIKNAYPNEKYIYEIEQPRERY